MQQLGFQFAHLAAGLGKLVKRRKCQRSAPFAKETQGRIGKKIEKETCKPVEQEENHETGSRWSWARNQMGNPSMNSKSPIFKVVLGLALMCLLICLVAAAAFLFWIRGWGHYSSFGLSVSKDSQLIAIFHAHKGAFEKLQQMATEDAQYGWYFDSSFEGAELDEKYRQEYEKDPQYAWYFKSPYFEGGKLNEARRKEYEDLVSEISPGLAVGTDYDSSMAFTFAGGGTSAIGPGWSKGIEYVPGSRETNGAVYGNSEINGITYRQQWQGVVLTNLDNAQTLPANVYLQPIESNWFIFYQRTD